MEEGLHNQFNTETQDYPSVVPLESKIFEVASIPNFLHGCLYFLPILSGGNLFIRYICTGSYKGIVPKIIQKLQDVTGLEPNKIFPWELYTEKDLKMHSTTVPATNHETLYTRKVGSEDSGKGNKKSILSIVNSAKLQLHKTYAVIFIHKAKANPSKPVHR
ncbi:MAG: hypothetical protein MJE68_17030 [Proteobacteria bacterium]|nr:hypothetical protein [Pseudomonadota bacterium]